MHATTIPNYQHYVTKTIKQLQPFGHFFFQIVIQIVLLSYIVIEDRST
jgi:hypothetical protein